MTYIVESRHENNNSDSVNRDSKSTLENVNINYKTTPKKPKKFRVLKQNIKGTHSRVASIANSNFLKWLSPQNRLNGKIYLKSLIIVILSIPSN